MSDAMFYNLPDGSDPKPKGGFGNYLLYSILMVAITIIVSGLVFIYNSRHKGTGEQSPSLISNTKNHQPTAQPTKINNAQSQLTKEQIDELNKLREEAKKQILTPKEQAAQTKESNKIRQQQIKIPPLTAKEIQLQKEEANRLREAARASQ